MKKEIILNNTKLEYELHIKRVKNINLRIKSDGTVSVSANRSVAINTIEDFMKSKSDFILKAVNKYQNAPKSPAKQYFTENELIGLINEYCRQVYPHFSAMGIPYPQIKFKKMTSRWGSCHTKKKILTFNLNLVYAPRECAEYVVIHEFVHFIQPNHSPAFHKEVEKLCPDHKIRRKKLKETIIPQK